MHLFRVHFLCLLVVLSSVCLSGFGQEHTVSGYVKDFRSGEPIRGAKVLAEYAKIDIGTNEYGFFALTLPKDSVRLVAAFPGYRPVAQTLFLDQDTSIQLLLTPIGLFDTVPITVRAEPYSLQEDPQNSSTVLPVRQITRRAALFGEADVLKTVHLLSGVQPGREGSDDLLVRGGSRDQNLILLDGEPLYSTGHLYGLYSILPRGSMHQATFLKGGFPARYGGRASSVLDFRTKDGNTESPHGYGQLGALTMQAAIEGPIIPGKTTFVFAARRSWFDAISGPVAAFVTGEDADRYFFSDIHFKLSHIVSSKDRLYLSIFNAKDRFTNSYDNQFTETDSILGAVDIDEQYNYAQNWSNTIVSLRWNHQFQPKLFSNITVSYNRYAFQVLRNEAFQVTHQGDTYSEIVNTNTENGITDLNLRTDIDFYPNAQHHLRMGGNLTVHEFQTGQNELLYEVPGLKVDTTLGDPARIGGELNVYLEDDYTVNERLRVNMGMRLTSFVYRNKFFPSAQPRLNARYLLDEDWAVKLSYSAMQQPLHLLDNTNLIVPTERWLPATDRAKPQFTHQVVLGIGRTIEDAGLDFSMEAFFKHMNNVIDYRPGADYYDTRNGWEDRILSGKGRAYGVEAALHKTHGRFNGWLNYTLSWSDRKYEELNGGEAFPFKFDRRHSLNLVTNYQLSKRINISGTFTFGSGYAANLPTARYGARAISPDELFGGFVPVDHYGTMNAYRMPAFHRMDLSINFRKRKRFYARTWNISIYNVYNRQNAFYIFLDPQLISENLSFMQGSLFSILPSITYKVEF